MALRKTLGLLPEVFQTDRNEKFLNATLDQLVTPSVQEKINAYVGRRFAPSYSAGDEYVVEPTTTRQNYQLEPGIVYKHRLNTNATGIDRIEFLTNYVDILNRVNQFGGNIDNHDRLFENEFYNWSSFFDFDKFVNFSQYYWLPNGPDSVQVFESEVDTEIDFDVTRVDVESAYFFTTRNSVNNPTLKLARGGSYTFNVNQVGDSFWIQTEPGLSGTREIQSNISTRDVLGVENNGDDLGTITFNVPEIDAQDQWTTMTRVADIDFATRFTYNQLNNRTFSAFIEDNPDGIDGIAEITVVDGATIVFYNTNPNDPDSNWESGGLFDGDGTGYDEETYDPTTTIALADRHDIYTISIDTNEEQRERFRNMSDQDVDLASEGVLADIQNQTISTSISIDGVSGNDLIGKTVIFTQRDPDDASWIDTDGSTVIPFGSRFNVYQITDGGGVYNLTEDYSTFNNGEKVSITEGTTYTGREFYKKDGWLFLVPTDEEFYPLEDGRMVLTRTADFPVGQKVFVGRGEEFGNLEIWKNNSQRLELVPTITAPLDRLYYQDGTDANRYGIIDLVEAGTVPQIDVENDIIGKNEYIGPNPGLVEFTNGMKVEFNSDVTPSSYAGNQFYVEGVGQPGGITLTPVDELIVPEPFTDTEEEGFDTEGYDETGYAGSSNAPTEVDYFTINRSSKDRNAWSRSNRWVHIDVIEKTATYNNFNFVVDQDKRANRPIIEFEPDLQLYNYGRVFKQVVTLFDTTTTDALSDVEGKTGYFVDGIQLLNGISVIFSADEDELVRSKIYQVEIIDPDDDGTNQIHLVEVGEAELYDVILVQQGTEYQGIVFHYDGSNWIQSQQKTTLNQTPYFDIFDTDGNSFSDDSVYFGTGFTGTKLFSYRVQPNAAEDTVLGFGLAYKNFENVGDIIFENNYVRDKFTYSPADVILTKNINDGFVHHIDDRNNVTIKNDWTKVGRNTRQFQVAEYIVGEDERQTFQAPIAPREEADNTNLFVYKNNTFLKRDTTQNITNFQETDYTTLEQDDGYYVILDEPAEVGDLIIIRVYSREVGDFGYYEIPQNLENNAQNKDFTTLTLGQIRNHVQAATRNSVTFYGDAPGNSNLRDVSSLKTFPGQILQHSAGAHVGAFLMSGENINFKYNEKHIHNPNFINAIDYAQKEYAKFKQKFIEAVSTLEEIDLSDPVSAVDLAIAELKIGKSEDFPFFYSDMIGYGDDNTTTTYTVTNPEILTYDYGNIFDGTVPSRRSILVYLNNELMYLDTDYIFDPDGAIITFQDTVTLAIDDVITIKDYSNTDGSFIPPTPTKMGLYPKYKPEIYEDNTFVTPRDVIQGHDGSIFVAFGDQRDAVILELEKRIYNNIKVVYNTDVYDLSTIMPGKFRESDYTRDEMNSILSLNFLNWTVVNRVDYTTQFGYDISNKFTWNYSNFTDKVDGESLPGHWRGIYRWMYDTDRPHTHPWEMLGVTEKPSWWDDRYGAAPYTKGNEVLWENLRDGKLFSDAAGEDYEVQSMYTRANLLSMIPVDENGNLADPLETIVGAYSSTLTDESYIFGDVGPAESAWRRSSDYPFAIMKAAALANPAKFLATRFDVDNIVRNADLDQIVDYHTLKRIKPEDLVLHGTEDSDGNVRRVNGVSQYVSDWAVHRNVSLSNISDVLQNLELQLVYRVGGYTDKTFLKVLAEQVSPTSTNKGIFIPDDDYAIELTKSAPVSSVSFSGVIITKTNTGWTVSGYDAEKPYFDIIPSVINGNSYQINAGDVRAEIYRDSRNEIIRVPYNTQFTNKQQVVDFFVAYQRWLESQGFVFDEQLDESVGAIPRDFVLSAKEFLFWQSQGWKTGSTITLNPVANKIKFELVGATPDGLDGEGFNYKVLNQNSKPIRYSQLEVKRIDNLFTVQSSDQAGPIYMIEINPVQYEHTIVFNNTTVFNDVLYQPQLGSRQFRLKLIGFKTGIWDGTFHAPGFIFNSPVTETWQPGRDYKKGDFVVFRKKTYVAIKDQDAMQTFDQEFWRVADNIKTGLLPSLDNLASRFETFNSVDQINNEDAFDRFGKGLIGYQKRDYLENLELDDVSQIKFYQGMIRQKGTGNAINKLIRAQLDNQDSDINYFEEWAFRVGEYGAIDANQVIEVALDEANFRANPELIEFLNDGDTRPQHISYTEDDLFRTPNEYQKEIFSARSGSSSNTKLDITTAGFPRLDDVDATIFDIEDIAALNNRIDEVGSGFTIWTGSNRANVWDVYRVSETFVKVISAVDRLDNEVLVRTDRNHGLSQYDFIAIRGSDTSLDGFFMVTKIVSNVEFVVSLTQTSFEEEDLDAILLKLESTKFGEPRDIAGFTPLLGWQESEKAWLQRDVDGDWQVLKKAEPWDFNQSFAYNANVSEDQIGTNFSTSNNNLWGLTGMPSAGTSDTGAVITYVKTILNDFVENETFDPDGVTSIGGFGTSVAAGNTEWAVIGAPTSNGTRGYAAILKRGEGNTFSIFQFLRPEDLEVGDLFGTDVAISDDERWVYVSAPGRSRIYVYALTVVTSANEEVVTEVGDGSSLTSTLYWFPDSIDTLQIIDSNSVNFVPNVDYTLTDNIVTFTSPLDVGVEYTLRRRTLFQQMNVITRDADVEDSPTNDNFGLVMATNDDGRMLVVGAPNRTYYSEDSSALSNAGAAYVFERAVEGFIGDGTTATYSPVNGLLPTNIMKVWVDDVLQTYTISLSLPGDDSAFGDYTTSGGDIVFRVAPTDGAVIKIEVNAFPQVQRLLNASPADGDLYGNDVSITSDNNWIVVGAPGEDAANANTGAVYVYAERARRYGTLTGQAYPAVNAGHTIRINDINVTLSASTLSDLVDDINELGIAGVTASVSNNALKVVSTSVITGDKLRIMPLSGSTYDNLGVDPYILTQQINHPSLYENEQFGKAVAIDRTGNFLAVGSSVASTIKPVRFDFDSTDEDAETIFDGNSTKFFDREPQSGAVYVYDYLAAWQESETKASQFGFIQQLQTSSIDTFDEFGTFVTIRDGKIIVGAPKYDDGDDSLTNSGLLYEFDNSTLDAGWQVLRSEAAKVDVNLINKGFIYNRRKNEIIEYLDWIDPIKGKIAGVARQELAYTLERDPAIYNTNTNSRNSTNVKMPWGSQQVGQLWWDTSTVRYLEYEQGDLSYRSQNWGAKFPGSSIDVYEWVESDVPPSRYTGEGTPKYIDDSSYVVRESFRPNTNTPSVKYYFWVKGITATPAKPFRKLDAASVARVIDNPKTYGLHFIGVVQNNAIIAYNIADLLEDHNVILHINYDVVENSNVLHSEYQLLAEGDSSSIINSKLYDKFVDSLSGENSRGDAVPSRSLSVAERYGVLYRPRQTMFVDRNTAIELFVTFCNSVFSQYQIANQFDLTTISSADEIPGAQSGEWDESVSTYVELGYLNPAIFDNGYSVLVLSDEEIEGRWTIYEKQSDNTWSLVKVQAYDASNYWDYATWYADGFNENTVVNYAVDREPDLESIRATLSSGDLVKIRTNDSGQESIVELQDDGSFAEVVVGNGTIELRESLYDQDIEATGFDNAAFDNGLFDKQPAVEIRKIVEGVKNDIFIEDIRVEWNRLWFTMIEYLLTEQPYADWLFKTSFIKIIQKLRGLDQYPNYQRDNQDYIQEYVNEAKPYRTNIREYILQYTKDDPWDGDVTDFDVHSYFDTDRGYYRKPSGELSSDAALWEQGLNIPWGDNYTFEVGSVIILKAGSGYTIPPVLTVTGGGGSGAELEARTNGDSIISVTVVSAGSGYTSQPTVTIEGVGTGLEIYLQLQNQQVRQFDTTVKFDRITYSSDVQEWAANTAYEDGDIVSHNGEAYEVTTDFTSGTTFDAVNMTVYADANFTNAADRIEAYYVPTEGMIGKDITQLQFGTDYPGVLVYGPDFGANPGYDVGAFDIVPFDAFEIDEDGITVISGASALDVLLSSQYTDATLGTAAEDINIVGGAYVDSYNSHSPEEFVPGIIFDTLDLQVYTLSGQDREYDGNASRIFTEFHEADGSTAAYRYRASNISAEEVDNILCWTELRGSQREGVDFTVNYTTGIATFTTPPADGDTIYFYTLSTTGEMPVAEKSFTADGGTDEFTIIIDSDLAQQAYVVVDGTPDTAATITVIDDTSVKITTSSTPASGAHVHVILFDVDPDERVAYSTVNEQYITSDGSTRTFTLDQTIRYAQPLAANIVVEVNGSRLRPPNVAYYTGDNSTSTFYAPTSDGIDQSTITNDEIVIGVIDYSDRNSVNPNVNKIAGTDYSITPFDGSSARAITFIQDDSTVRIPSDQDTVIFGILTEAEYTVSADGTTLTIDPSVSLSSGDEIRIVSFSNHDMQRIQTNVFVGTGDSSPGQRFTLDRIVTNSDYLWVTVDGTKLHSAVDYSVAGNKIVIADSIALTASSVVVVSGFSENISQLSTGFRIFKDMINTTNYYRISADNITTLAQDLDIGNSTIYVTDSSVLGEPVGGTPGFVMIDGERITYWEKDDTTNTLTRIRRNTAGTGAKATYAAGERVYDLSNQKVPGNTNTNVWYEGTGSAASDGRGLQNSDTVPARYLVQKRTLLPE